jgi:hypothetical protein
MTESTSSESKVVKVNYQDPDKSSEMGLAISDTVVEVRSPPASVEPWDIVRIDGALREIEQITRGTKPDSVVRITHREIRDGPVYPTKPRGHYLDH